MPEFHKHSQNTFPKNNSQKMYKQSRKSSNKKVHKIKWSKVKKNVVQQRKGHKNAKENVQKKSLKCIL